KGLEKLGQGDFAGAREAVASAAQLITVLPDDENVKAFFVLSASELKLEYGQVGGDWDQARRVVEKMKGTRPAQNRARAAYALASGDVPAGKQILATLGDAQGADPESTWLYAQALILSGEGARASQLLDGVLKTRPAPRLLLLRGNVARDRGQLPEAAGFYQKILQASPESARAMVELADVRLRLGDGKGASELLARALDTDRRKTLDAGEEARANVMRGRLLAAAHDVKGAEAAFEHAVMLDPGSAAAHEAYGDFRIRQREWEKASRQFESAIQHGGGASAYAGAARAFLGQNRLLEADKAITDAVTREPGNARFLYLQGRVADAIGKAEEAYRKYEAALKAKPDLVEALAAEGVVWMSRNDRAKAQERLDAAIAVKPEGLTALEDEAIGDLALAMGDAKKAQEAFGRALEKDAGDAAAHAGVGKALAAQGVVWMSRNDKAKAQERLDAALAVKPEGLTPAEDEAIGDLALAMGDAKKAQEAFARALHQDQADAAAHAGVGKALAAQGDLPGARREMETALKQMEGDASLAYEYGSLLRRMNEPDAALAMLRNAVKLDSKEPRYRARLGAILVERGEFEEAEQQLRQAVLMNDRNPEGLYFLGRALAGRKKQAEAIDVTKRAVEIEPDNAEYLYQLGLIYERGQQVQDAIDAFTRSLDRNRKNADAHEHLGQNLMVENRFQEAA
ncbi:MAG TPA: tetratricopeptide repeat protein, partial [Myxococcales bacterium]|nr:tetratricopeptide repeat protein [Myxococcales bacterium]